MVTMSDVARVANVSASTVSHVINKTRKVNAATELAVRNAIEATGYSGDGIARSLRTGSSRTIGVAMSAISNPYFGDVVHAMERVATDRGYTLLLTDTHDTPDREQRAVRDLVSHRVDGVVWAPSPLPDPAYDFLERRRVPVVLVDRVLEGMYAGVDAIGVRNVEPIAELVDHLVQVHAHTRIAMLAPREGIITTRERVEGFRLGLQRNGVRDDLPVGYAGESSAETLAVLSDLLRTAPTALVLGNNMVTVEVIGALRRMGLTPPEDIATVSFDDFLWADSFHPRLTTVAQPIDELGTRALQMLLQRIVDPGLPPRQVRLDATIQVRESCGCGAVSN